MFAGDSQPCIAQRDALDDGDALEYPPAAAQVAGMDLLPLGGDGREEDGQRFVQIPLEGLPRLFRHDQCAKDEDRLFGIAEIVAGVAGFVEID